MNILDRLDSVRRAEGYLTVTELLDAVGNENVVYDPFSVLISRNCKIGCGNIIYPCVYLTMTGAGRITIGDNNIFHSNSVVVAESGHVEIGNGNQFGEGGFTAKANRTGAEILIGDKGRYLGGASVFGTSRLGTGSQILGNIMLDGCVLADGEAFTHDDPDHRAGLVKGTGSAKEITVPRGRVAVLNGQFRPDDLQQQSRFHRKS